MAHIIPKEAENLIDVGAVYTRLIEFEIQCDGCTQFDRAVFDASDYDGESKALAKGIEHCRRLAAELFADDGWEVQEEKDSTRRALCSECAKSEKRGDQ